MGKRPGWPPGRFSLARAAPSHLRRRLLLRATYTRVFPLWVLSFRFWNLWVCLFAFCHLGVSSSTGKAYYGRVLLIVGFLLVRLFVLGVRGVWMFGGCFVLSAVWKGANRMAAVACERHKAASLGSLLVNWLETERISWLCVLLL